ncbi:type I toxin-antitoxin system SymE family toxin [Rosenbergiella epipactidis]|uniref:SymE family type I addiction module toxin n=1 Tax=Rosenbergiella epipactidis TaxID=1544694 RepID=UPI0020271604|nr:SymE family type I addiction module toxin [Rosenbergiella epipactidis]MCL9666948.1 type I toxin-antitoxin system SymE family toxin [Rosenbergiella epipactidis]
MTKHHNKPDVSISKTLRPLKMGYVSMRHYDHKTHMSHYYSRYPCLDLKGDWLAETGFATDTSVIVIIEQG